MESYPIRPPIEGKKFFDDFPPSKESVRRALGLVYGNIAVRWAALGYTVIPGGGGDSGKRPRVEWTAFRAGHDPHPAEPVRLGRAIGWADQFPDCTQGLLVLDSNVDPAKHVVVIDVDDPQWLDWVIEHFGDTPMKQTTGRDGGGWHLFYRRPASLEYVPSRSGHIGPPDAFRWPDWPDDMEKSPKHWGTSPIDVKGNGAYVVAPGSVHRTGRAYHLDGDLEVTEELLAALPEFRLSRYEEMSADNKKERKARKRSRLNRRTLTVPARKALRANMGGRISPKTLVSLADGSSGSLEVVAANLTPGGSTASAYCPQHHNTDTPAAAVGVTQKGGVFLKCFGSCDTTFWMAESGTELLEEAKLVDLDALWDAEEEKSDDGGDLTSLFGGDR